MAIAITILAWVRNVLFASKWGVIGVAMVGAFITFKVYNTTQINKGRAIERQAQVETNDKAKTIVRKARRRVSPTGSAKRLRKQWCRDC